MTWGCLLPQCLPTHRLLMTIGGRAALLGLRTRNARSPSKVFVMSTKLPDRFFTRNNIFFFEFEILCDNNTTLPCLTPSPFGQIQLRKQSVWYTWCGCRAKKYKNRVRHFNLMCFLCQAFLSRAAYYGMKGRYSKGIMSCNEAIKLQPRSVRAYLYRFGFSLQHSVNLSWVIYLEQLRICCLRNADHKDWIWALQMTWCF